MREDLLEQLETWHEEDEFEQIVDAIADIPEEERDYELVSHLGRAMNNLERYEEAVEQFLTVAEEGQDDPLWHYRIGLAYYYLDRYEEALRAFEAADKLDPGDEDTLEFLDSIRQKLAESEPVEEPAGEPVPAESKAEPVVAAAPAASATNADPDSAGFWDDGAEGAEHYISGPPADDLIASVEESLVFKLPASYIEMMKQHNGGIPRSRCFPVRGTEAGDPDHITISGIMGIGREKRFSLCGPEGSRHIIETDGYPEFGVVICPCPSGSGVVMLDYRPSGNDGEPEVVYVDKERNHKAIKLAPNFEAFIRGLVHENAYKTGLAQE
jgi:hypothetical protein